MKRKEKKESNRAIAIKELKEFIKQIGDVPMESIAYFDDSDEGMDLESDFNELADDCQEFVHQAREKMESIAKKIKMPKKDRSWL